jgi:hypothetical protein
MKSRTFLIQITGGVALALLCCGISQGHPASAPLSQNAGDANAQAPSFQQISWEHEKIEKLQHAYHLLEHADGDYAGHKEEAKKSIRKAAEVLGVDLHGKEHPEESQWKSDRHLREARRILKELIFEGNGVEQPHIHKAIKEIDRALETK